MILYRQKSIIFSIFPFFVCFQNEHFLDEHMLSQCVSVYKSSVLKTLKHTSTLCNEWLMSWVQKTEITTLSVDFLITKQPLFLTLSFTYTFYNYTQVLTRQKAGYSSHGTPKLFNRTDYLPRVWLSQPCLHYRCCWKGSCLYKKNLLL